MKRRQLEEDDYDDVLADEGTDDEAQNDAEGKHLSLSSCHIWEVFGLNILLMCS